MTIQIDCCGRPGKLAKTEMALTTFDLKTRGFPLMQRPVAVNKGKRDKSEMTLNRNSIPAPLAARRA